MLQIGILHIRELHQLSIVQRSFVNQAELANHVENVARKLAPDVVRIRYDLGEDWSGEPSVFFRIVLADKAVRETSDIYLLSQRITLRIQEEIGLDEAGFQTYFNFRTDSEQAVLKEPAWT